jgi:hypothetical protein
MRAIEFIFENVDGKLTHHQQQSTRGAHVFANNQFDRYYDLNRVMMAAACSDGVHPIKMSPESWSGKNNTAHPYTQEEQDMLTLAYKAAGIKFTDINNGNLNSLELDDTNTTSTLKPFKGYKKK